MIFPIRATCLARLFVTLIIVENYKLWLTRGKSQMKQWDNKQTTVNSNFICIISVCPCVALGLDTGFNFSFGILYIETNTQIHSTREVVTFFPFNRTLNRLKASTFSALLLDGISNTILIRYVIS
jgi:hypothetical protein